MATVNNSTSRLRAIRKRLIAEQERLELELHELIERTSSFGNPERAAEMSGYDDHPADLASETFEREKDLALEGNIVELLNKVNTALEKLDEGSYGMCDACGVEINASRMEALPWASFCRDCQDRVEGR